MILQYQLKARDTKIELKKNKTPLYAVNKKS